LCKRTKTLSTPSITCVLVKTKPSCEIINPEPLRPRVDPDCRERGCLENMLGLLAFMVVEMLTTLGWAFSTSSTKSGKYAAWILDEPKALKATIRDNVVIKETNNWRVCIIDNSLCIQQKKFEKNT